MYRLTNKIFLKVLFITALAGCSSLQELRKNEYQKYISNDAVLNVVITVSGMRVSEKDSAKIDVAITNNSAQSVYLETKKPRLTYSAGPQGCNLILEVGSAIESGLEFPIELQRLNPSETITHTRVVNYDVLLEMENFMRKTQQKELSPKSFPIHLEMIFIERFEDIIKFKNLSTLNQTIQDTNTFTISSIIFDAAAKKRTFEGLNITVTK